MVAKSNKIENKPATKRISGVAKPQAKKQYLWVIKLKCLPFGFFEEELLGYFRQFGSVIRVRVARSTKTGHHKGWAYVGFDNKEVAEIAAETMNGYLMFEHRLSVKLMKADKIPKCMLKGSTLLPRPTYKGQAKRDAIQRNKTNGEHDAKRAQRRQANLGSALRKLKNMGIDYEFSLNASKPIDKDIQVIPKTPKAVKIVTPVVTPKSPAVKTPQMQKVKQVEKTPKFSPKTRAAKKAAATPAPAPQQSSIQKAIQKSVAASARPATLEKRALRGKKKSM